MRAILSGLIISAGAWAQAPTGTIAGLITDPTGAAIYQVRVVVNNTATGLNRTATTSSEGTYSTSSLPAGAYEVSAEAPGFSKLTRTATVEAGTTTTVNLDMQVGATSDSITVDDASPQIQYDSPQVGGVVHREQIQELPLNGRSFLELAKLEPGVTPPTRATNNRTFVAVLGAPRVGSTRTTVDGGSIMQIGAPGSVLNLSQEVVQEFQIATVNMDNSTGVTAQGGINIVTRSGGNALHGSAFYFFRDHYLSAYPALARDPKNTDPFFQRQQWGYAVGGPIKKDRVFFFTNLERNNQRGVATVQPRGDFAPFAGIYPSPFHADQASARFDFRINDTQNAFVRYSHDGNTSVAPLAGTVNYYPSSWVRLPNWADQSIVGLTNVLRPTVVNDFRFSYLFLSAPEQGLRPEDCPGCIGIGSPEIDIPGTGFFIGNSRTLSTVGRRYHFNESLSWQKSTHRMRMGFEYEWAAWSIQSLAQEPAVLNLYSPEEVGQASPGIPLPASFSTLDAILQLPLRSFVMSIGSPWVYNPNGAKIRAFDSWRLYWQDTWQVRPRLALNYGVSWAYSPHDHNYDLSKPAYLTPILGRNGLPPTRSAAHNLAPSLGLAWNLGRDGKTVVRAGAGLFYDNNLNAVPANSERKALSPRGTGRSTLNGSGISWNGVALDFQIAPTNFTGADLLSILPGIRAGLLAQRDPNNRDFSVRNIDVDKQGEIYDHDFTTPYAVHLNLGIQRELARDLVVHADFVLRQFTHNFISGIDYNHYNSLRGRVIPQCIGTQTNDPYAECSNGMITVDNTAGRSKYKGLLVRVDKRLSRRIQFVGSYALSSNVGFNGTGPGFNNDNWFSNYGPVSVDQRHLLNLSGIVELPKRFQVTFNSAFYSRMPFNVYVHNLDFNGDGTSDDVLPGARVNGFNRGLDKSDLARLVDQFNQNLAGTKTSRGQAIPVLRLPANYELGKNFQTQDVRLSRSFVYRERYKLTLMSEIFNLLNIANLGGYSGNVRDTATFGQPQHRADQVFGSGGPRSFQLAARISF